MSRLRGLACRALEEALPRPLCPHCGALSIVSLVIRAIERVAEEFLDPVLGPTAKAADALAYPLGLAVHVDHCEPSVVLGSPRSRRRRTALSRMRSSRVRAAALYTKSANNYSDLPDDR